MDLDLEHGDLIQTALTTRISSSLSAARDINHLLASKAELQVNLLSLAREIMPTFLDLDLSDQTIA